MKNIFIRQQKWLKSVVAFSGRTLSVAGLVLLFGQQSFGQQLQMSDFVLFSGSIQSGCTSPSSPGAGVFMGSSSSVTGGGTVGSLKLVSTSGSASIMANISSPWKSNFSK